MAARRHRIALIAAAAALAVGSLAVAGCGSDSSSSDTSGGGSANLSGSISVDGSSTVGPLTSAAAESFSADGGGGGVNVTVGISGTGGGFEKFCSGQTDISDASRAIKDEEKAACEKAGVAYEEFRVASDGITVVTKAGADVGGDNLTLAQLKAVWSADSKIDNWQDIPGGTFTDAKLTLAGPGSQSGTYDFFNETVLGEDAAGETLTPRQDYTASEDDNVIVQAVESAEAGMGYFGYSYFEENQDKLADFAVDGVKPTPATITDGSYPLSRPLFIYVSTSSLERPEVKAFVTY